MTQRITCYVVFVTLVWGAHTETKQTRPDVFKSNMTRSDFSNLLSSLIKLNEQRVNVLQKLNRLEEYKVLSEVLRSSDKKTKNGNSSNLYLIVMSKQGPVDAKQIVQKYQTLLDNEESLLVEDETPTEYDDERYELVGLVTLKSEPSARRNIDLPGDTVEVGNESGDNDLQTRGDNHGDDNEELKNLVVSSVMRALDKHKTSLRSKILRTECINENKKETEQCSRACNKAHTDVCDRRSCSLRAKRNLKTECGVNCEKIFDAKICDT